jgi:hypothetical protein
VSPFLPHGCTSSVPMIRHQNTQRVWLVEVWWLSSTSIQWNISTTNIIEHAAATSISTHHSCSCEIVDGALLETHSNIKQTLRHWYSSYSCGLW